MLIPFKALLFDLDGTLVDSWPVVVKVMEQWSQKHGLPLEKVLKEARGARSEDTVARVAPHLDAEAEALQIEELETAALGELQPIGEAAAFLASLPPERWALVTSSTVAIARQKMDICGLPWPQTVISAESITHGKPHPEGFLKGAQALGVAPQDCLVFEDADNGVKAAIAAGCRIIVVGGVSEIEHPLIVGRIASYAEIRCTGRDELEIVTR